MARMTEREWMAFSATHNLDPRTGRKIEGEPEPDFVDIITMRERLAKVKHIEIPKPPKSTAESELIALFAVIAIILFIWVFG